VLLVLKDPADAHPIHRGQQVAEPVTLARESSTGSHDHTPTSESTCCVSTAAFASRGSRNARPALATANNPARSYQGAAKPCCLPSIRSPRPTTESAAIVRDRERGHGLSVCRGRWRPWVETAH
jgi:hypothetical protein